jgi:hypothetical protein
MDFMLVVLLGTAGLFLGMLVCLNLGRCIGVRRLARDPDGATAGVGTVEGAVFGLLALLVAFAFSGAAARFETRRQLIIAETNDIGTAYLRLDLLPLPAQPPLRDRFRQYVTARLEVYGIHYYVRQLRDMKGGLEFDPGRVRTADFPAYCMLCGWALALAHAKAGDAALIAGYAGTSAALDESIARFALAYADQTEQDHATLSNAARSGRIQVAQAE